jgi:hypothetical protein
VLQVFAPPVALMSTWDKLYEEITNFQEQEMSDTIKTFLVLFGSGLSIMISLMSILPSRFLL